jgi:Tetracyclin repressor-like, C-terminal domain
MEPRPFVDYLSEVVDGAEDPIEKLHASGRAYLEFTDLYPGRFEVMFRPTLVNPRDADYKSLANIVSLLLNDLVAGSEQQRWQPGADTTALTVSTWALFHGLAPLRRQGSLADHLPDTSAQAAMEAARTFTSPKPARSPSSRSLKLRRA